MLFLIKAFPPEEKFGSLDTISSDGQDSSDCSGTGIRPAPTITTDDRKGLPPADTNHKTFWITVTGSGCLGEDYDLARGVIES